MIERMKLGKSRRASWPLLGLALLACSGIHHDCFESRDCPGPKGFIEAGADDDWWSAGAGGQPQLFDPPPSPGGAGPANALAEGGVAGVAGADSESKSEPPRIVSVAPADGASGVRSNTAIVIRFSQAMAAASVEAAYRSADLGPSQLSFAWDDTQTTLTLTPNQPLLYATGAAFADGSGVFDPKTYRFGFGIGASDRAGQPLSEASFSFSTLRRASFALATDVQLTGNWTDGEGEGVHNCVRSAKAPYAPSVCVGDDAHNVRYTGFLSFDLSLLPDGIVEFSSARLQAAAVVYGAPGSLGENRLDHVSFGELGEAAVHVAALASLGSFLSGGKLSNGGNLVLSEDLTQTVADDYASRVARSNRSQYRLAFDQIHADGVWDDIELLTSDIHLAVACLVP